MNYNSISIFINEIDQDLNEINDLVVSLYLINNIKDLINIKNITLNSHFFCLLTMKRYLSKTENPKLLKNKINNIFNALQPEQIFYNEHNVENKIVSIVDKFIEINNYYDLKLLFTFLVVYDYEKEVLKIGKKFIQNKDKKMIKLFLDFLVSKDQISNYIKAKKIYDQL